MRTARGACDDERLRLLTARPDAELEALAGVLSAVAEATEHDAGTTPARNGGSSAPGDWRRWG
jgi:hypothetical protein